MFSWDLIGALLSLFGVVAGALFFDRRMAKSTEGALDEIEKTIRKKELEAVDHMVVVDSAVEEDAKNDAADVDLADRLNRSADKEW